MPPQRSVYIAAQSSRSTTSQLLSITTTHIIPSSVKPTVHLLQGPEISGLDESIFELSGGVLRTHDICADSFANMYTTRR